METGSKLMAVREIRRIHQSADLLRDFIENLSNHGVVKVTRVPIAKRVLWRNPSEEGVMSESVRYFKKQGSDLNKSIRLAHKSEEEKAFQKMDSNLYPDWDL